MNTESTGKGKAVEKSDVTIASKRDKEIFFDAITNAEKPSSALLSAAKEYTLPSG